MAIIGKIRQNVGLLVFVIALAILAFLLMDALSSSQGAGGAQVQSAGTINGEPISYQAYERKVEEITRNYQQQGQPMDDQTRYRLREQAWNQYIQESLSKKEYDKLGLSVTDDELKELFFDPENMHPTIKSTALFQDESGQFSEQRLKDYIRSFDDDTPEAASRRTIWNQFETAVLRTQMNDKYTNLVSKAVYAPTFMAKRSHEEQNKKVDFKYAFFPYTEITDEEISFSDADLNTYLKSNAGDFKTDKETRSIDYITFPINPSAKDSADAKKFISDKASAFRTATDIPTFLRLQNSEIPYNDNYISETEFASTNKSNIVSLSAGATYGPYFEDGAYKVAKMVDKKMLADSADIRIITLLPTKRATPKEVTELRDSIFTAINNGGDMEVLANQFSDDKSKENGGNFGYVKRNQLPPAMNTAVFYERAQGEVFTVTSQQGEHIIEILEATPVSEGMKIAYLGRYVDYSRATQNKIYAEAQRFILACKNRDDFAAKAKEAGLAVASASGLDQNSFNINGVGLAQDITTWAFKNDVGAVCDRVFQVSEDLPNKREKSKYIVSALTAVTPKGTPSLDAVRTQVETKVKEDKKAVVIQSKLGNFNSVESAASNIGKEVESANGVLFNSSNIPGIGFEPKVQAAVSGMDTNSPAKMVQGSRGVYVIQVNNVVPAGEPADMALAKKTAVTGTRSGVQFSLLPALSSAADVEDVRFKNRK